MNFWQFLDRCFDRLPGWPSERQWVTIGIFSLAYVMLRMAVVNGDLWNVELFKILLQGIIMGALISSVIAFHFAANKHEVPSEPQPVKIEQPAGQPVPVTTGGHRPASDVHGTPPSGGSGEIRP